MAKMTAAQILPFIRTCGLAPGKAKNLAAMARALVAEHGGEVPRDFDGARASSPASATRRRAS